MKLFSLSAATGLASTLALLPLNALANFPDVPQNHPNYAAIEYVQKAGIVSGYSDGTFHPDQKINRAEFAKILVGTRVQEHKIQFGEAGIPPVATPCFYNVTKAEFTKKYGQLPDIDFSAWYGDYVCNVLHYTIAQGYPDGTFKPNNNISFVEAAKMIVRSGIGAFDQWNEFGVQDIQSEKSVWFLPFVMYLEARQAIPISIHTFEQTITRGEMAEMLYRLQQHITDKTTQTYDTMNAGQIIFQHPAGFSFAYNPTQVQVPTVDTNYCPDPKDLAGCPRPQYQSTLISARKMYNGGDYIAAAFTTEIALYHSYDVSHNYPPASRTLFTEENVDAYVDQFVEGFKNDPTFLDGRGPYITKVKETSLNGQRVVALFADNRVSTLIFRTQPYPGSISFIGVIDMDGELTSETDMFMQSLMNSLRENVQEVYSNKSRIDTILKEIASGARDRLPLSVTYSDIHGLFGGTSLTIQGNGEVQQRVVTPSGKACETKKVTAEQLSNLVSLLVQQQAWEQREPERAPNPDESRVSLNISYEGVAGTIWEWYNDAQSNQRISVISAYMQQIGCK